MQHAKIRALKISKHKCFPKISNDTFSNNNLLQMYNCNIAMKCTYVYKIVF